MQRILKALGPSPRILGLGGHVGVFGAWALTLAPGADLTSLEPDPQNFGLLAATARRSGRAWAVLEAAATAGNGWGRFAALGQPGSHLTGPGDDQGVAVVTLDVLPLIGGVDFVKLDIEGGEWAILSDPRWPACAPKVVAMEFHPEGCPREDFEAAAIEAVAAAGMEHRLVADTPCGAGMLWAWRST